MQDENLNGSSDTSYQTRNERVFNQVLDVYLTSRAATRVASSLNTSRTATWSPDSANYVIDVERAVLSALGGNPKLLAVFLALRDERASELGVCDEPRTPRIAPHIRKRVIRDVVHAIDVRRLLPGDYFRRIGR